MHGNLQDRFFESAEISDMISQFQIYGNQSNQFSTFGLIKVVQAYWKSQRKVAFLTYYDEYDREQKTVVDDNYIPNTELGESVKYKYINQVYQGTKLGDDIYLDVKPYTDAILDLDRLDYCPLPIEGCTYNDTNARPLSLVDLMRPWNEMYNITAYELRKDMNSSLGKVLFMSVDHIPDIPGFTWEKWYYWAKELKIAWVKQPPKNNQFNQFSAADMSFAQQIVAKMDVLERMKQECDSIAGFSAARLGGQSNASTLGENKQQFVASVNQTEYYFFKHNKLVERVLNFTLNLCKKVEKEFGVMRNSFSDLEQAYLDSEEANISTARLTLFVTNSAQDLATKQKMEQLLSLAVSNGADVMDCSDILLSQSISETRSLFRKLRRRQKDNAQATQEHEKELLQIQQQDKAEQREWDKEKHYSTMENNLQRDYIKTFGYQQDNMKDTDADGQPDILEIEEFAHNKEIKTREQLLKERKQYMDEQLSMKKIGVEEKKADNQRYAADISYKIAKENKTKAELSRKSK
jgi:hypothetical protein